MSKTKKKFEFSKLIQLLYGVIDIGVLFFTLYMV